MLRLCPIVSALFVVSAALAQTERPPNATALAADIAAGASTFRSHCAACHGLHGEGGRGPSLAAGVFFHGSTDADLEKNIASGIPGTEMPGLFYSSDRISQLVLYIRSLGKRESADLPGDVAVGRRVYAASECANCHRISGEGGWLGPDLSKIGAARSAEFIRRSITNPDDQMEPGYWTAKARLKNGGSVSGYVMSEDTYDVRLLTFDGTLHSVSKRDLASYEITKASKMPSFQGRLNAKELDDLVAYLHSLRPGNI